MNETLATQLTGSGRAAVATVALRGSHAVALVMERFRPASRSVKSLQLNRIHFGTWVWQDYQEELVVCRVDACEVEIHCHGGRVAARSILDSLAQLGARVVSAHDWMLQTEPNRFLREARELLPQLKTAKAVAIALDQSRGALPAALLHVRQKLQCGDQRSARQQLSQIVQYGTWGVRLGTPFRIVVVGPPNSGKSSLINALVGYDRAIVYDRPGTTRDLVTTETAIDGWSVTLADTAGIRDTQDPVERAGIELAKQSLLSADLLLGIVDLSASTGSSWQDLAGVASNEALAGKRMLRVGTKCDAPVRACECDVQTSAVSGEGIDPLCRRMIEELVPIVPPSRDAVPLSPWQQERVLACLELVEQGASQDAIQAISLLLNV